MRPVEAAAMMLFFILMIGVLPMLILRYRALELRHREKMEAFERGIPIPSAVPRTSTVLPTGEANYLLRGLIWTSAGFALTVTLFFLTPLMVHRNQYDRINEIRELSKMNYDTNDIRMFLNEADGKQRSQEDRYRGLAALGLIPAAVGVAYLVFYYEQRRRPLVDPPVRLLRSDQ